jgi:hypothetical protein
MKKYLFGAMALPLLFACSSEDFENEVVSNDQFAGIEKVDATFVLDEGPVTRMATAWEVELNDMFGFAWMGGTGGTNPIAVNGEAYQNHPLTVVNDPTRGKIFKPQTSIYVGKYYLYRPYDYSTVDVGEIKFNSLVEQPLADGANETWNNVAKNAILIGDKWTDVKVGGTTISGKKWDEPGINKPFQLFSAFFSNQTALDLTYSKNNPAFAAAKNIKGATDIDFTIAAGETVGAADIYSTTVKLDGAAKSFTYAPTAEPNAGTHKGHFWEGQKDLNNTIGGAGFTFANAPADVITLKAPTGAPISTGAEGNKGWFWFNSLPKTDGDATSATNVTTVLTTSYGNVTVVNTLAQCAWAYEDLTPNVADHEIGGKKWAPNWIKLDAADAAPAGTNPRKWDPSLHNTFVNQYGNHKGKYAFTVDFSTGVMNGMHITDDTHLQKALKYYLASGKNENVVLNLDGASATDKTFKLSKISIALLQTINASGTKVLVQACGEHNNPVKIVVTQEGSAGKTEVPNLNKVFAAATDVYLANTTWTWKERTAPEANVVTVDGNVASLTNEGTLEVNASNIQLSTAAPIKNAAGATMKITKVTTVKNALTNLGTINVGDENNKAAELRAYNAEIKNDATGLADGEYGVIINYGVVGKSAGTTGAVNNYGYIKMLDNNAITLLNSNEVGTNPFASAFVAGTNMMGVVELPSGNPYALVSVSNADETGFIKYEWNNDTYAHDPGNVKYNTIIVKGNKIAFSGNCTEIKYIEFNGTRTQVINPVDKDNAADKGRLPNLKGIAVYAGKSIIIEKTNGLRCAVGSYLQPKTATAPAATVYRGGVFDYTDNTNYFGNWNLDQIVEY